MSTTTGWLFDLYARGGAMVLWFAAEDGERLRLTDPFEPRVFLGGPAEDVEACLRELGRRGDAAPEGWTERTDFWTGRPRPAASIRVLRAENWTRALSRHAERFPRVAWYNADLPPEQCYCYERDVYPLMSCRVEHEAGRLLSLTPEDDRWAVDYATPPLRTVELEGEGSLLGGRPRLRSLTLSHEGRTMTWDEPEEMLGGLQRALGELDPDVILTSGGDSFLFPVLFALAERTKFPFCPDRDPPTRPREVKTDGRSFFSYGRILYQAPEYALLGRWHLDRKNSFMLSHDGMEGLFEVARLARLPVQRIARRSIGTGISSIQLGMAWREGILVPWKKTAPEAWKSARQLLQSDRGGLVYAPETGVHENVVELDFVAMYPNIMSRFNVSPETVNCPCCRNARVPEIGYTICERRAGLVSRALRPIIEKRVQYKALRAEAARAGDERAHARYHARQDALKWMLVCCFGYLGYRNARFGRIEAHEAVSAWSREIILRTREICEARGWHMLHANVDCVWIVKPGFRDEEIATLSEEIAAGTDLPIALEGIYKWLAFLPSRQVPDRPVPTRYFGAFRDGTIKYRGIECRRSDYPAYIKAAQLVLLEQAAGAADAAGLRAMVPDLLRRVAEWERQLREGEAPMEELVIRQSLSRDPGDYTGHGAQSLAARQAAQAGLNLHAGETLSYILTSAGDHDRSRRVRLARLADADTRPDPGAYIRLLRRAANTVLWPAGVTLDETDPPPRRKTTCARKEHSPTTGHRAGQMDLFEQAGP